MRLQPCAEEAGTLPQTQPQTGSYPLPHLLPRPLPEKRDARPVDAPHFLQIQHQVLHLLPPSAISSAWITFPRHRITARSTVCFSSRTLPGQA